MPLIKHRESGLRTTPEYISWKSMLCRCRSLDEEKRKVYRSRGITVCARWRKSYPAFLADMGRRPSPRHTLDRIKNDRGYSPGNVRWATPKEQSNNRRDCLLTIHRQTRSYAGWSDLSGVPSHRIRQRIAAGWSPRRAVWTSLFRSGPRKTGTPRST